MLGTIRIMREREIERDVEKGRERERENITETIFCLKKKKEKNINVF